MGILLIEGMEYKIRYIYTRDDGTEWYVLKCQGGLMGDFGDEYPVAQTFKYYSKRDEK
jgi:hypothetical protein